MVIGQEADQVAGSGNYSSLMTCDTQLLPWPEPEWASGSGRRVCQSHGTHHNILVAFEYAACRIQDNNAAVGPRLRVALVSGL